MIESFKDKLAQAIFDGDRTKDTKRIHRNLIKKTEKKLDLINAAIRLEDLKIPPGNKLEKLSGNYKGYYSIRVDGQWRLIFKWKNGFAHEVQFIDYH
jgi:proteic killer suppression protein